MAGSMCAGTEWVQIKGVRILFPHPFHPYGQKTRAKVQSRENRVGERTRRAGSRPREDTDTRDRHQLTMLCRWRLGVLCRARTVTRSEWDVSRSGDDFNRLSGSRTSRYRL